jgi:serine/threonine-protein kinase/endoribonuclease IRE1
MQPGLNMRDAVVVSLLLASLAGAAAQHPSSSVYPSKAGAEGRLSVADYHRLAQDSLQTPLSGQTDPFDRNVHNKDRSRSSSRTRTSHNERALATLVAPAGAKPAVEALPPALTSQASPSIAGFTRQLARSLQDWKVEDLVLLATVDGGLHAVDRNTGAPRWHLESEDPMVDVVYHSHNKSDDGLAPGEDDSRWLWIVEPTEEGTIYVYRPGSGAGMERLSQTVKQLADSAPYAAEGEWNFAYTAEKKNEIYTIDAATGNVLKVLKSSGSMTNQNSCRRVNPLESLEEEECEPIGTLTIARTTYILGIEDPRPEASGPMCTIRYIEWVPNNRDQDLRNQYAKSMDNKYVYTKHDGTVFGGVPDNNKRAGFHRKLEAPVARVFDLIRPTEEQSAGANLVILPQPVAQLQRPKNDDSESVFIRCNPNGTCYAMSESNYPLIANDAPRARWYDADSLTVRTLQTQESFRDRFSGLHDIALQPTHSHDTRVIGAPDYPGIEAPPEHAHESREVLPVSRPGWNDYLPSVKGIVLAFMLGMGCVVLYTQQASLLSKHNTAVPVPVAADLPAPITVTESKPLEDELPRTPKLRQDEPAKETIFPHEANVGSTPDGEQDADDALARLPTADGPEDGDIAADAAANVKKHKRGKRGGRKQKEKSQAAADGQPKRKDQHAPQPAELISVEASESSQVSGPLQINHLVIHTDKVIGQGSCGTMVFEGSFEGRDVAVKRMLSQFYDLASQEVSFLQQSDDHPNVVRYFCQQKDHHFLYIAVELCQASLFEVWESEKARTEQRQAQLRSIKLSIQQDTPRALQQLAAGLYHLHNLRIIHRDIKPQNILVAFPKRGQNGGPRLVISDFGLGKNLPENQSTILATGNAGTSGWKAPELICQPRETDSKHSQSHSHTNGNGSDSANGTSGPSGVKRAADIFSLGCLFFWVLTDGTHPYEDEHGWQQLRELNIKRDNKNMRALEEWSDAYEPMQLITSMLEHQPENRPTALQVLNHPFFWTPERRLAFLCDVSDHFEREPRGTVEDKPIPYCGDSPVLRK